MREQYSFLNGELVHSAEAKLHVSDLGILRGFGLFDFFRVLDSTPIFFEDHVARFRRSAEQLGITVPVEGELESHLRHTIQTLVDKNAMPNSGLVLLLTGGYALDGFTPSQPNFVVFQRPLPTYPASYYQQGITLMTHQFQREFAAIKSTNYAMGVRLATTMKERGAQDVLYHDGTNISETTRCNIFVRVGDRLLTPSENILEGITRKQVIALATQHISLEIRPVSLDELRGADEVFITSSTKEVMPVRQIDDAVVGSGEVGVLSKHLLQHFRTRVTQEIFNAIRNR